MSVYPAEPAKRGEREKSRGEVRPWNFESAVDWFETEGSVFTALGGKHKPTRMRVVLGSQQENKVIKSLSGYFESLGFHPLFRPTCYVVKKGLVRTRSAECELLRTLEQYCFLKQCLPLLRTEKRIREVKDAIHWLEEKKVLSRKWFKRFDCPNLG